MQICRKPVAQMLLGAVLLACPSLLAQDDPVAAESMTAIEKEYEAASEQWMKSYRSASKEERQKLVNERPDAKTWLPRVQQILAARPQSDDGCAAAIWVVRVARASGSELENALDVLAQHHLADERIGDLMLTLSRNPAPAVGLFLTKAEAAAEGEMLAKVCFAHGSHLKSAAGLASRMAGASDEGKTQYAGYYGRHTVDVLAEADASELEARAVKYFERILADDAMRAVDYYRGTMGEAAEGNLFELQRLAIGKVAPDIVGEDIDGVPMKLSDYRGKVVVIDFWGDW